MSHVFTGGTPCDLADLNRETEVIFKCSDQSDGVVAIVDVSEPATCRYGAHARDARGVRPERRRRRADAATDRMPRR